MKAELNHNDDGDDEEYYPNDPSKFTISQIKEYVADDIWTELMLSQQFGSGDRPIDIESVLKRIKAEGIIEKGELMYWDMFRAQVWITPTKNRKPFRVRVSAP
jgi:hypothetical protein